MLSHASSEPAFFRARIDRGVGVWCCWAAAADCVGFNVSKRRETDRQTDGRRTDATPVRRFTPNAVDNLYFTTYDSITTIQYNMQHKTIEHNKRCELD